MNNLSYVPNYPKENCRNVIIKYDKFSDDRGKLYTIYSDKEVPGKFIQDKVSISKYGTIRGLHGDSKTWKAISCLGGRFKLVTYDVYFGYYNEYILDADDETHCTIIVPPGVLNGHQCLSEECIFFYKWSKYYTSPDEQWSVNYRDSEINAQWKPLESCILSERDLKSGSLADLKIKIREDLFSLFIKQGYMNND